ncbi:hypothetical protein T4E_7768 [Trichinella pseudospiralis]|uniref:Homeobox domain-containing protein n=1 Tax=Trichinella pseudospiralis TaxID=6337 RepID=A0A0V0XEE5_TRIPS|nr:hypothetical protein T4E_7768 [Trichinella pseudospiralis]
MSSSTSSTGVWKQSISTQNPSQSGIYKCAFCNDSFEDEEASRKHFFRRHLQDLIDERRKEESIKRDYYWNNQHEQKELTLRQPGPQQLEIFDSLGRRRPFGRRPLSKQKANILEEYFECSVYLKKEDTARLLARCNLPYNVVRNWFSYTRQKQDWRKSYIATQVLAAIMNA